MLFAPTRRQLEIIILNEVRQKDTQMAHVTTSMWNLKQATNEPVYEAEIESQMQRRD